MTRRTSFVTYAPKHILNKGKRADHWFWTRYSAYPYIGCQHGCLFCYCRERKYCPYDDPQDFAHVIKVKENAASLLHRELVRVPIDAVFTGDYQAAERKFGISRQMLEVCLELGFPVFILERSPLVLRDLDLIRAVSDRAAAVVAFSIISAPGAPSYTRVCQMENLAPPAEKRFKAMAELARAGIVTGACCMPILPGVSDDSETLRAVVRTTAEHGGQFVIASGLTLADQQKDFFMGILNERFPDLVPAYRKLYPAGSYSSAGWPWPRIGLQIRDLCREYGIHHRVPRPVIPGEKLAVNKRVVEALANELYDMELRGEPAHRQWAYRKAAWAIENLEQDLRLILAQMGPKCLASIPEVGVELAAKIQQLVETLSKPAQTGHERHATR